MTYFIKIQYLSLYSVGDFLKLLTFYLILILSISTQADAAVDTISGATAIPLSTKSNLPPPPAVTSEVNPVGPFVFGENLFNGKFSQSQFSGFNPDYRISVGDRISLRMWGSFVNDTISVVDPQGNIFIPNVGEVKVTSVRNSDLNDFIKKKISSVYKSNVDVYASLDASQPVKVFVTGFVLRPGMYGGVSSDSILYYLDQAGGIDVARGSFLNVSVLRDNKIRDTFNLYDFLLDGRIRNIQLAQGDVILVSGRKNVVVVFGDVLNPFQFEFNNSKITADDVLKLARPRASATHLSILRRTGDEFRSDYIKLDQARNTYIEPGDEVTVTSDKFPGTILLRVEGSHLGSHALILPYGAKLGEALNKIKAAPQSELASIQLFRKSVATRQKEMLDKSLKNMESYVLTASSQTNEEAQLRMKEAELVLQYVARARSVVPKGQVFLANNENSSELILEDGDVINVPERSSTVMVHGEVLAPNAIIYKPDAGANYYISQAGGYTQKESSSRLVIFHQNGGFSEDTDLSIVPGDEIMVLPKIETKNIEIARGITQIMFQIAVVAGVILGIN